MYTSFRKVGIALGTRIRLFIDLGAYSPFSYVKLCENYVLYNIVLLLLVHTPIIYHTHHGELEGDGAGVVKLTHSLLWYTGV